MISPSRFSCFCRVWLWSWVRIFQEAELRVVLVFLFFYLGQVVQHLVQSFVFLIAQLQLKKTIWFWIEPAVSMINEWAWVRYSIQNWTWTLCEQKDNSKLSLALWMNTCRQSFPYSSSCCCWTFSNLKQCEFKTMSRLICHLLLYLSMFSLMLSVSSFLRSSTLLSSWSKRKLIIF